MFFGLKGICCNFVVEMKLNLNFPSEQNSHLKCFYHSEGVLSLFDSFGRFINRFELNLR